MSTDDACNREKLLFDVIDYLTRHYDISERQITTTRSLDDAVMLTIHDDASEFPGFGSSEVNVFEMSDEITHERGYVPRGNTLRVWTTSHSTPDWE